MAAAWRYQTALVTGASSGIGTAFATLLARKGCDVILVARSADRLERLAATLRANHGRRVEVIVADLAEAAPGARLAEAVDALGMDVDLLVNNAGFATTGAFAQLDPERERDEIAVNITAVVDLAHAFLPAMLERGCGAIVNVASLAAMQPVPYMSVYAATKAFVLSFSGGLWAEVAGRGVHVLAVCPGPVDTAFFEATGRTGLREAVPAGFMLDPATVAAGSLDALVRRRLRYVPGLANRAAAAAVPFVPRRFLARMTARVMHRGHDAE